MSILFTRKTVPVPGRGGFPIPEFLHDLFNKIFRKEQSLYTRKESPALTIPEFKTYSYRGVPIQLLTRLIVVYDDPVLPTEVYTIHRKGSEGTLVKVTKVLTDMTLAQLGITEPPDDESLSS